VGRSKTERLIDIFFADDAPSAENMDQMRRWLVDPQNSEEKSAALYDKFTDMFRFDPAPTLAPEMWPELARRLGMNETVVKPTVDPLLLADRSIDAKAQTPTKPNAKTNTKSHANTRTTATTLRLRRIALRAAAVLVPVAIVLGATVWFNNGRQAAIQNTTIALTVPVTDTTQTFTLPDGSSIVLEPGGAASYDSATFDNNRVVTLAGDALFDVATLTAADGSKSRFTVETNHLTVNVLGTMFRLSNPRDNSSAATVSLYRGSVGVKVAPVPGSDPASDSATETVLEPGQRFVVNPVTGHHSTEAIPVAEMAVQGMVPPMRFDEASLAELTTALALNFEVQFTFGRGVNTSRGRYSADFEELSLDEILDLLSMIDTNLAFERSGDKVVVSKR
jgi:ferric-dicitrate binding protein FerR (iron transport regulator)